MVTTNVVTTGVVFAVLFGGVGPAHAESASNVAGCYVLTYGTWAPPIEPSALAPSLPPHEIELTSLPSKARRPKSVIREYRGQDPSGKPPWAYWQSDSPEDFRVGWSIGWAYSALFLRRDPDGVYRGRAQHLFDDGGRHEADVTATRVECAGKGKQNPARR